MDFFGKLVIALWIAVSLFVVSMFVWAKVEGRGVFSRTASIAYDSPATVELSLKQDQFYLQPLINALIQVESNSGPNAIGDGGKAVGVLQLHKIYVDDANRMLGENRYSYDDRYDAAKSIEMFLIVSDHYADHYQDWSDQGRARRHNGGPTGHLKEATLGYWKRVEEAMR